MSASDLVAIYGAILATLVALAQLWNWWHRRVRVKVHVRVATRPIGEAEGETARGTAVLVRRGRDELWEEFLVSFEVRNAGGAPVQIVAVVLEHTEGEVLHSIEIVPEPLPTVVAPATKVDFSVQKEFIDLASSVIFFGVVDALGRRYSAHRSQITNVIEASWSAPTRVRMYQRRDDVEGPPVKAFQMHDRASMRAAPVSSRKRRRVFVRKR